MRVWLDVDLNRANGNALTREAEERRRRGDPRPVGRWSFEPPRPAPVPLSRQFFDRHRPDLTADVLFGPVSRMVPPVEVRSMNEVVDFVLRDEGNALLEELEDLLPVETPAEWGADGRTFQARGLALSEELQRELGPDWKIIPVGLGEPG